MITLGIRERLGKIKERILKKKQQNGNGNGRNGNGESRTMTEREVKEREYHPTKKAKIVTTKWEKGKPTPKETPKSGLRGWLERSAEKERVKKKQREERKRKLEQIKSAGYTKGVEDYYRKKGRSEGYAAAKAKHTSGWGAIPIIGESTPYTKRLASNVRANPIMRDILGPQYIRSITPQKSNKRRRQTIKVVIQQGGKVKRKRKKRKQTKDPVWAFTGL